MKRKTAHRLHNKDLTNRTAICSICGNTELYFKMGHGKLVQTICINKRRELRKKEHLEERQPYRKDIDLSKCAICGFVPQDRCQIDVDHINAIHSDNSPNNLQALCANCHRLKSKKESLERRLKVLLR